MLEDGAVSGGDSRCGPGRGVFELESEKESTRETRPGFSIAAWFEKTSALVSRKTGSLLQVEAGLPDDPALSRYVVALLSRVCLFFPPETQYERTAMRSCIAVPEITYFYK